MINSSFRNNRQEDASEFLIKLLESILSETNNLIDLFKITTRANKKCSHCDCSNIDIINDSFMTFPIKVLIFNNLLKFLN